MPRRIVVLGLALVAAVGLVVAPAGPSAPREVRAATPDLTIVTEARYEVQPERGRVRVTLDLTLRNRLKDTKTTRYYFDEAFLAVLPGSSGFRVSWDGAGTPGVRAARRTKTHTLLRIDLARRLYAGRTAEYKLRFDLKDPGGSATRELRIGESLVSFPVWAFATDGTPGSSVTVVFPAGYEVVVEAGSIPQPTTTGDGRTVFRTGRLDKPLEFFAYLVGDRPGAYVETPVRTEILGAPVDLVVRSWPDDERWGRRVSRLLDRALPVLGERIGLEWPHDEPLTVTEALRRSTRGYAGLFDPAQRRVEIAYYAADFVVLHEAAHAWFNGSLLADRWANEAFASLYAEWTATELEVESNADTLTDEMRAARIPLNAWGAVGTESTAAEDYAYVASLELARAIAERAGGDGLARVWDAAAEEIGAYQPTSVEIETVDGPPDWRGLLDLLETHTHATYDDLWRTWVARPTDLPLLDERAEARARYDEVVARAGIWELPRVVRDAMRAWRFEDATMLLHAADHAVDGRAQVDAAARAVGLSVPPTLQAAFEDDDGFDDSIAETRAELEAIARYAEALAVRPPTGSDSPYLLLGLWGETPEVDLAEAKEAFAAGDLAASVSASTDAAATWAGAEELGRGRAISIALLALAAVLALLLVLSARRRRRARRMMAHLRTS
jgi:hypothetical protein